MLNSPTIYDTLQSTLPAARTCPLLAIFLEKDEREKVVEELGQDETEEAIASMAAFSYLALGGDQPRLEECL